MADMFTYPNGRAWESVSTPCQDIKMLEQIERESQVDSACSFFLSNRQHGANGVIEYGLNDLMEQCCRPDKSPKQGQ